MIMIDHLVLLLRSIMCITFANFWGYHTVDSLAWMTNSAAPHVSTHLHSP